jgi:magnesium-transporting ATPase (P-type)
MKANTDQPKAAEPKPGASTKAKPTPPGFKPGSKPDPKDDLKTLPIAEVERKLDSSPDGLTDTEAKKRLAEYGPNEIEEEKTNLLLKFLSYFWGPIPWMIEAAVILSGVVGHWEDFGIILILLLCNAVIGFWEERQAGTMIHWSADGWKTTKDIRSHDVGLGIHFAELPVSALSEGRRIKFTFYWPEAGQWEGKNFTIRIAA